MLTFTDFQEKFSNETDCFNYLYNLKWPNGFDCPKCHHHEACFIKTRKLFQCKNSKCKHQTSVTAGTIFHKTRQPLLTLFWACFWIATCKKGISSLELQRKLGIKSYPTAWLLHQKIRHAMKSSGKNQIKNAVEFDQAFLGKSEKHVKTESSRRAAVKVVVETDGKNIGRAYLEHLQSDTADVNKAFIEKNVAHGVIVKTDGSASYKFLSDHYQHQPHKMYDKKDNEKYLPKVHIVVANLKMWLRGTHNHLPYKHTQRYLDEFTYRFNRRGRLKNIFENLMRRIVTTETITYQAIVA